MVSTAIDPSLQYSFSLKFEEQLRRALQPGFVGPWRTSYVPGKEPEPTEKQVAFLKRKGQKVPATKREAGRLITQIIGKV